MREVYIDTYEGNFHPCDILDFRKNILSNKMVIFFYDRANDEYCYANMYKEDNIYYIDDVKYYDELNLVTFLANKSLIKKEVSELPLYIMSKNHKVIEDGDILVNTNAFHASKLIKKLEFLELKSYVDAIRGPIYYYFIILESKIYENGYIYTLKYSTESNKTLNKNIIAKHETMISKEDMLYGNGTFTYVYNCNDSVIVDQRDVKLLAEKIIELEKNRRANMDTALVSKVVRIMMLEEDKIKAAKQYKMYLEKYYDKWLEIKNNKVKKYSL